MPERAHDRPQTGPVGIEPGAEGVPRHMRRDGDLKLANQRPQPPVDVMAVAPRKYPADPLRLRNEEQQLKDIGVQRELLSPPRLLVVEGEGCALEIHMRPIN